MFTWVRERTPAGVVFLLALCVRVTYNLTSARHYYPAFDDKDYYRLARTLTAVGRYAMSPHDGPLTNRAPFWPYLMSALFTATHPSLLVARLFLSVLGSGTCLLVYLFARDLFGGRVALATGLLAAVYPGMFVYDGFLYTESVYTFLLTAFGYSLFRLQRTRRRRWLAPAGVALGCAALTRPNGLVLLLVVAAWAALLARAKLVPWRVAARWALVVGVLAVALIAPWTARNYRVTHGAFIPIASGSGNVLSGTYNDTVLADPERNGMWEGMDRIRPPVYFPPGHHCCDYTGDKDNTRYALHWIRTHPGDMPYVLTKHLLNMWTPYTSEEGLPFIEFPHLVASRIVWYLVLSVDPVVFVLAAAGLVVTWRRFRQRLTIVYLVLGETILLGIAYYGSSRFRAPIEPLLVLLAGGAFWWLTSSEPGSLRAWRAARSAAVAQPQPSPVSAGIPG